MKLFCVFFALCFAFCPNSYKKSVVFNDTELPKKDLAICIQNFDKISKDLQINFLDLEFPITFVVDDNNHYKYKYVKKDKEFVTGITLSERYNIIRAEGNLLELKQCLQNIVNEFQFKTRCVIVFDAQKLDPKHIYVCLSEQVYGLYNFGILIKNYSNLR